MTFIIYYLLGWQATEWFNSVSIHRPQYLSLALVLATALWLLVAARDRAYYRGE